MQLRGFTHAQITVPCGHTHSGGICGATPYMCCMQYMALLHIQRLDAQQHTRLKRTDSSMIRHETRKVWPCGPERRVACLHRFTLTGIPGHYQASERVMYNELKNRSRAGHPSRRQLQLASSDTDAARATVRLARSVRLPANRRGDRCVIRDLSRYGLPPMPAFGIGHLTP